MRGSSEAEAFAYLLQLHWNFTQDWVGIAEMKVVRLKFSCSRLNVFA